MYEIASLYTMMIVLLQEYFQCEKGSKKYFALIAAYKVLLEGLK